MRFNYICKKLTSYVTAAGAENPSGMGEGKIGG